MTYEGKADLRSRTKLFALNIVRMYSVLPGGAVAQVCGRQVLRSASSVGANYREAYRARSRLEFTAKIGDCLKELEETSYWLELLRESNQMDAEQFNALHHECDQLIAIMTSIAKKTKLHHS